MADIISYHTDQRMRLEGIFGAEVRSPTVDSLATLVRQNPEDKRLALPGINWQAQELTPQESVQQKDPTAVLVNEFSEPQNVLVAYTTWEVPLRPVIEISRGPLEGNTSELVERE